MKTAMRIRTLVFGIDSTDKSVASNEFIFFPLK